VCGNNLRVLVDLLQSIDLQEAFVNKRKSREIRRKYYYYTVNLAPAQSHIWHMLCKICFIIILCWLHLRRIWHTMCQKNGEAYLTHVKQNMLHMWLSVLHLRQLCHIVCHIWLCAGTDLQCIGMHCTGYLAGYPAFF
jgi:hypothetical protein